MLIVLLLFIGLIVYLNKALYQPIINFMDERDKTIAVSLKEAQELSGNAEHLHQEAEAIINSAKQEAAKLRQSATDEATAEAEKLISSKEAELEKAYEEFTKKLEAEREELKNGILSQVPLIKETLKAKFAQLS
jgi:F-type H+-transporting ATPase subunit b